MAGQVRQPIDVASLERYVAAHVPEIQIPLDVKQVWIVFCCWGLIADEMVVWLRTEQSNIPVDRQEWQEVCHEEEASGSASFKGTTYLYIQVINNVPNLFADST
jgi:hypothetical protein